MTYTLIILAATLLASVWIAVDLLKPGDSRAARGEGAKTGRSPSGRVYAPIARLLADADFDYLAEHSDLVARLGSSRRATMRLYLVELRREFLEGWHVCRLLAPISPDPAFVSRLSRQYWSFHWTFAIAYASSTIPSLARRPATDGLVSALSKIRAEARELLVLSDPALALPAAA